VLDDEPFVRKMVGRLLERLGAASVHLVETGDQGLALIRQGPDRPDIVITDLNLPGMNGIEFLELAADEGYGGGVILISGDEDRDLEDAAAPAIAKGVNFLGAVTKPVSVAALIMLIDLYTDRA
jgi:CheY-like chemotaxis protein